MAQKSTKSKTTTNHGIIRKWIEERDGQPARVKASGEKKSRTGRTGGILRIDFGEPEASLEPITWDEFFDAFEKNDLAFLYQEEIEGHASRFFKFVSRGGTGEDEDEDKKEKDDAGTGESEEDDDEDDEDDEDDDWEEVDLDLGEAEAKSTEDDEKKEQEDAEEDQGNGDAEE